MNSTERFLLVRQRVLKLRQRLLTSIGPPHVASGHQQESRSICKHTNINRSIKAQRVGVIEQEAQAQRQESPRRHQALQQ